MRRLLIALAVLLTASLAIEAPAGATALGLNRHVSGPFNGTTVFNGSSHCSFFDQAFNGTYTPTARQTGAFHLDGCVTFGPGSAFTYTGIFRLTSPRSGSLTGTVNGVIGATVATGCSTGIPVALDLVLTPTHGTKQFKRTEGTVHLAGRWCSPAVPGTPGPITGALTGNLSKDH